MTMKELAKIVNVSVSTVSKAFCDADDVSTETKNLIFEAAKKYGCYGKYFKGKYPKPIIAIICPEINSGYYTQYIETLQNVIEGNNAIAVISSYNFNNDKKQELIDYYASHLRVDGVFVIGSVDNLKKGYETPIVSLLHVENSFTDCVIIDLNTPIIKAVEILKDLGHKKIAFISETLTMPKAEIFLKALGDDATMDDVFIVTSRFEQAGEDGAKTMLESGVKYTAVICAYDDIAFGAIKYLKTQGLSVPEDISVIGIDNLKVSKYFETSLTTIGANVEEVCMVAWDLMEKKLKNKFYVSRQKITITGNVFLRESVGKAK